MGYRHTTARLMRRAVVLKDYFGTTYATLTSIAFGFAFSDFGR